MNTQPRSQSLLAGQAMLLPVRSGPAVLVQGEVLVQAPARWLGGVMVVPRPTRLAAPAMLPVEPSGSVLAVRDAVVVVQERPSLLSMLSSVAARVRPTRPLAPPAYGADTHA